MKLFEISKDMGLIGLRRFVCPIYGSLGILGSLPLNEKSGDRTSRALGTLLTATFTST